MASRRIQDAFEQQAAARPTAISVEYEGTSLTYAELNERANRLAHFLLAQGVRPDDRVAIYLDRSVEMIVALLGTLKAGGAYVPMDPVYPAQRLGFIIEDAEPKLILTSKQRAADLTATAPIVCLDERSAEIGGYPAGNPHTDFGPEHLAYVIFTSGSTGRPKGVMVTHANVLRLFTSTEAWFSFGPADVWTMFHSYGFDFSVWEIWGALLYGGRLVVVPSMTAWLPDAVYALLSDKGVTVLNQTPSAFKKLVQADERLHARHPLKLRLVIFGGEALELAALGPWFDRHGDRTPQLVNMYGITETTVHVTYRPLERADLERSGSVIGCPIPDLELHLLDANQAPVPVGEPGEIFVGGAGVARGYIKRPDLTAQRFVEDVRDKGKGRRLYRSGDLARYREDGELEYLGRIDNQVKIRGFRIELGEIEAAMAGLPGVLEAVVLVRPDPRAEKQLVGYIVLKAGTELDEEELQTRLAERLPQYMIPARLVTVSDMPLTPNGKVDREALAALAS